MHAIPATDVAVTRNGLLSIVNSHLSVIKPEGSQNFAEWSFRISSTDIKDSVDDITIATHVRNFLEEKGIRYSEEPNMSGRRILTIEAADSEPLFEIITGVHARKLFLPTLRRSSFLSYDSEDFIKIAEVILLTFFAEELEDKRNIPKPEKHQYGPFSPEEWSFSQSWLKAFELEGLPTEIANRLTYLALKNIKQQDDGFLAINR